MITRHNNYDFLSDDVLNKLNDIVNNKKILYCTASSKEEADKIKKELYLKGHNVETEETWNKFKIFINNDNQIRLADARKSGQFKKLAWGAYSFNVNASLGDVKYNFDDGSIWKVMKDEHGEEYLIKETNEEGDILRGNIDIVNENNYKNFNKLLELNLNQDVVEASNKNYMFKIIESHFNEEMEKIYKKDNISSDKYKTELKEIVSKLISTNAINDKKSLNEICEKYKSNYINNMYKL